MCSAALSAGQQQDGPDIVLLAVIAERREISMAQGSEARPALIAVDWGTTNRRGYLVDRDGRILDSCNDSRGLANIADKDFNEAFDTLVAPWTRTHGVLPALLSGMVGASTGWREAPYCGLPADLDDLAGRLQRVSPDRAVWIVPGVAVREADAMPDVMRGEEIQAIAAAEPTADSLIVLPGTHSKWVRMAGRRIVAFKTFMTGDLHAAIRNHTVVSVLAAKGEDVNYERFDDGVEIGSAQYRELSHILFGARSRVLFGELAPEAVSDYLSGLLIGAEIGGALDSFAVDGGTVELVGRGALPRLYRRALEQCGVCVRIAETKALGITYRDLAVRAGLIQATP